MIQAADQEIAKRKKEVELCQLGIKQLTDDNAKLSKEVQDKDVALGRWYHNPVTMATVGVLLGLIAAGGLHH